MMSSTRPCSRVTILRRWPHPCAAFSGASGTGTACCETPSGAGCCSGGSRRTFSCSASPPPTIRGSPWSVPRWSRPGRTLLLYWARDWTQQSYSSETTGTRTGHTPEATKTTQITFPGATRNRDLNTFVFFSYLHFWRSTFWRLIKNTWIKR